MPRKLHSAISGDVLPTQTRASPITTRLYSASRGARADAVSQSISSPPWEVQDSMVVRVSSFFVFNRVHFHVLPYGCGLPLRELHLLTPPVAVLPRSQPITARLSFFFSVLWSLAFSLLSLRIRRRLSSLEGRRLCRSDGPPKIKPPFFLEFFPSVFFHFLLFYFLLEHSPLVLVRSPDAASCYCGTLTPTNGITWFEGHSIRL